MYANRVLFFLRHVPPINSFRSRTATSKSIGPAPASFIGAFFIAFATAFYRRMRT